MCYFDQTLWACGYWKWGNFRQQCNKEYRTGETCGLKLVFETIPMPESCKLCDQMTKKRRRMNKMMGDIARWHREGNRWATIEKTQRDVMELKEQLDDLEAKHTEKERCLTGFV